MAPLPDHHVFRCWDLDFDEPGAMLMTEKDMLRFLPDFADWPDALRRRCLGVVVEAVPDPSSEPALDQLMEAKGCLQGGRA